MLINLGINYREEGNRDFHKRFSIYKTRIRCIRSCVCIVPTDQEAAPAWQRQSGQGTEIDSWSCFGMVSRNREWGLLGRDKSEQEQREVPGPVCID